MARFTKTLTDEHIRAHLASTGRIALFWSIDDVRAVRPDLNDEQCMAVLLDCERRHDAEHGVNWIVLETTADFLFPPA